MGVRITLLSVRGLSLKLTILLQGSNLLLSLRKFAVKDRQRRDLGYALSAIGDEIPEQNLQSIDDSICLTTFFE